jgi:dTDP-glucose 4,6-dehydratase
LSDEPLTVSGDGSQIRSACYVSDMVEGLLRVLHSPLPGPINLGDPRGRSILQMARDIIAATGSSSTITFVEERMDEPARRSPDITLADQLLDWCPTTSWKDGLAASIDWAREQLPRTTVKDSPGGAELSVTQRLPRARLAMER